MTAIRRGWRRYANGVIATEISRLTRYYDRVIQYARYTYDDGLLFDLIACNDKSVVAADEPLPAMQAARDQRCAVFLNGNFNYSNDIQGLLAAIRPRVNRHGRVIAVAYNSYFGALYRLASRLGVRAGDPPPTFVTYTDLENLARLAGFRVVRSRAVLYSPFRLLGVGALLNAVLPVIPGLRHLSLAAIVVLAPVAFIKIDVQGYELQVCRGMAATLDANPGAAVVLEYLPDLISAYGSEPEEIARFFAPRGYAAYCVTQSGALEPLDIHALPRELPAPGYIDILFTRVVPPAGAR